MVLITDVDDVPLDEMSIEQKRDVLIWLMVCELYERSLDALPAQIEAARALPEKQRIKELRRIKLSTWHGLSGRCRSDDPFRIEGCGPNDKLGRPTKATLMAAAQSLRAAALELDIKALVEGLEVS